ncbi:MAG TPA: NADH-ubiquinone oxidoreductase-F iron-sulfur binding region domain-containing protein [Acidimicrobiales bacterium]|nr:NADH-ubiquinone oxidoreductase-F iron-sulfur binding region domain-containing protein [Acidimicrobiales bacterium]
MTDPATTFVGLSPLEPARLLPAPATTSWPDHLDRYGPLPPSTRELGSWLADEIEAAGVRGRGGAAFPTATKLRAVAAGARRPVVVANGTEGEPASAKDKVLLQLAPHLVLDGIELVAGALGASATYLCVDRAWPDVASSVERARAERAARGRNRGGGDVQILAAPDRYVAGEESALVHWLNGGEARPTFVPPRAYERGVRGRPTFTSNVETYAQLALVARYGSEWYRALGTDDAPGTTLLTVTGGVAAPGVCEAAGGSPLAEVVATAGGPVDGVQAVLVGGYFGTWIEGRALGEVTIDPRSLGRFGASLGCGVVAVLPDHACPLHEVARVTRWLAGENAGQCGPCVLGLPAVADAVEQAAAGRSVTPRQILGLLELVRGRGACRHPDGVARFVDSSMRVFADHIAQHRRRGACPDRGALLPVPRTGGWR